MHYLRSGYGQPADVDASQFDIYLGKMHYSETQWSSTETATQWILDNLKAQGVTLRELES